MYKKQEKKYNDCAIFNNKDSTIIRFFSNAK